MNRFSKYTYWLCLMVLTYTAFFFYPKWEKSGSEATLSWDVCGYYYYLPAIFIYKDLKNVAFHKDLDEKYQYQGGDFYAALPIKNAENAENTEPASSSDRGDIMVMKYTSGMAVMYAPAFFMAHLIAKPLGFEADGFSKPYQIAIGIWSLLWAFVGLYFLRKVLLKLDFSDKSVSITLFLYVLATNYLNYAAVDNAMTHSYIFTLYAILLLLILKFHENPSNLTAIGMGTCVGLAVLARPTELFIILVPLLWGFSGFEYAKRHLLFLQNHFSKIALTAMIAFLIASIQLFYWKYTTGHFIYNSYGPEDKMEWLHTHIVDGFFSARKGWLVYTPIMLFSCLGFYFLFKKRREQFWAVSLFLIIFIYISFAHNIWWYGGGLGQRQMIQIYPILALPFAAFWEAALNKKWSITLVGMLSGICIYLNMWLMYQAHKGGHFDAEYTTPAYLRATLGRWNISDDTRLLLDNKYNFVGEMQDIEILFKTDFEMDTSQSVVNQNVINGLKSLSLDKAYPYSPKFEVNSSNPNHKKWLRASAVFKATQKEWNTWSMMQWIVTLKKGEQEVKSFYLRPHRIMVDGETKIINLDAKIHRYDFDKIIVSFWNTDSEKQIIIDDLKVELFN
jgi:hypothetical protein